MSANGEDVGVGVWLWDAWMETGGIGEGFLGMGFGVIVSE